MHTTIGLTITRSPTVGLTLRRDPHRAPRGIARGVVAGAIVWMALLAAWVIAARIIERMQ